MAEQKQFQKKPSTTVAETQNYSELLQTRPFAANLQAKSDRTNNLSSRTSNFGHCFGNLAVQAPTRSVIQPKLTIGQPGDKYEQEADAVAAQVVQRINAPKGLSAAQGQSVQREAVEEEELQMKPAVNSIRRQELPEEEELQMKPMVQRREAIGGGAASRDLEQSIQGAKGSGQPLDESIRQPMEQAFGADFSGVNVHTNAQADTLNRSLNARAFTTGQDLFFKQGEYNPGSRGGQKLIAHELTHVVQQNSGFLQPKREQNDLANLQRSRQFNQITSVPTNILQAQLMTSKDLEALTGVSRRYVLSRWFKALAGKVGIGSGGSSYDDIVGLLEEYEKIKETDKDGKKKAKRLEILTELEQKIFAWYNSANRKRDHKGEVIASAKGDDEKIKILQELMYEVVGERDAVASMSGDLEKGIKNTKSITANSQLGATVSPAEKEAQSVQQQQKSFWSTAGKTITTTWHQTFGTEFYPKNVVPLHTDFVSEYDIRRSAELIEVAMEIERKLISDGVDTLKATALAYQYLPIQLRPKSPEPEEKVVLKVKLQIFKESIKKKQEETPSNLDKAKKLVEFGGDASSAYGVGVSALETINVLTKEVAESYAGINELVGAIGESISAFLEMFALLQKSTEDIDRSERDKVEEKAGMGALAILEKLSGVGDKIAVLKAGDDATPVLGILSSIFSVIQNLIKGSKLLYRYHQEGLLNKDDTASKSGLLGALKSTAKRSRNLAISTGTEIIISALEIASAILGPSGVAGGIVEMVGKVTKYAKKAVEQVEKSYTAGLAQESQIAAESGLEESAKKVLESSDKWGITAIILEAKEGNSLAIKKLELYGLKANDIQSKEVEDIRTFIMEELEREENARTLTQKLIGRNAKG